MSRLKPMILQLVPDFDESAYHCFTFKEFLEKNCGDVVKLEYEDTKPVMKPSRPGPIFVRPTSPVSFSYGTGIQVESDSELTYSRILKKTQFRMLSAGKFEPLCLAAFKAAGKGPFKGWEDFSARVTNELPRGARFSALDVKHFQGMCYRSKAFDLDAGNHLVHLRVGSPAEIEQMVVLEIIRRIDNLSDADVDEPALSRLVFGDESPAHMAIVSATNAVFKNGSLGGA
jgi:hypothetical protein